MYSDISIDSAMLEYLGETVRTLDDDKDGKQCQEELLAILDGHPNVAKVALHFEAAALTKEETETLIQFLKKDQEMRAMEQFVCYKRGLVDGICLVKESGKIK